MYYDTEQPIPADTQWVARRIRLPEIVIKTVLQDMFVEAENGSWTNERADKLIAQYKALEERNRNNGSKGGRPKKPTGLPEDSQQEPTGKATNNQEPITINQEPSLSVPNGTDRPSDDEPLKEQKFPGCNHKAVLSLYHSTLPNLPAIEVWNDLRSGLLRQRWREVCQDLAKQGPVTEEKALDWWQKFFEFVGKSDFLTGKTMSKDKRPFLADLEWVIRPANFAKVVEGKYHRS
jgi:uncharacterized protein YdaU (DUF1376 family)